MNNVHRLHPAARQDKAEVLEAGTGVAAVPEARQERAEVEVVVAVAATMAVVMARPGPNASASLLHVTVLAACRNGGYPNRS